jgi:SAM-dependent methyltransferase
MILNDVKLYRTIKINNKKYLGSKDKRVRDIVYIVNLFPSNWFDGKTVLDVGCAGGAICFAVSPMVREAIGIDISWKRIAAAYKIARENAVSNVWFYPQNINDCYMANFDCIFLLNVLHHEKDPTILLGRCCSSAKEYVCIEHPRKGYFSSNDAYAASEKKNICDWKDVEAFVLSHGFKLATKRKSPVPHAKGTRIVGLFKKP